MAAVLEKKSDTRIPTTPTIKSSSDLLEPAARGWIQSIGLGTAAGIALQVTTATVIPEPSGIQCFARHYKPAIAVVSVMTSSTRPESRPFSEGPGRSELKAWQASDLSAEGLLDWDAFSPPPPPQSKGTIKVNLKLMGRSVPLPYTDSLES